MPLNIGNKIQKRVVGTLRRTQLVTTFGSGAIIDLPHDSAIIAGTDFWKNHHDENYIIHEENLEKLLGMDYFVLPKVDDRQLGSTFSKSRDIPAFRFPETLFCPRCGKLANYRKFGFKGRARCPICSGKPDLIPSRFVVACENGHLDDFPYKWWVHRGNYSTCSDPDNLVIFNDKKSGGLDSIKIVCKSCKKVRSMDGSFSKNALAGLGCTGRRPWLGPNDKDAEDCPINIMRTVQRGASNLYFGIHSSTLSIPPWSSKIQEEIGKRWNAIFKDIAGNSDLLKIAIKSYKIHEKCCCTVEEVIKQVRIKKGFEEAVETKSYENIIEDEYKALSAGSNNDAEFKTEETEVPEYLKVYFDKVVLVKKLREVMALKGFRRIKPVSEAGDENSFTRVSRERKNWLPAIELRGEGIFIKLDSAKLSEWEKKIGTRYQKLGHNLENAFFSKNNFSPRYVLLHTLAHLLIRQLVLQCGYSSSSIKERIYSTYPGKQDGIDMAGILIYTSTSDSDGSLGGLVREGITDNIANTVKNMLEEASWCSSDPICIQSEGQGFESLNYAACHSCTLLPETSCEARNTLLDRGAVVGIIDNRGIGYFGDLFEGGENL